MNTHFHSTPLHSPQQESLYRFQADARSEALLEEQKQAQEAELELKKGQAMERITRVRENLIRLRQQRKEAVEKVRSLIAVAAWW